MLKIDCKKRLGIKHKMKETEDKLQRKIKIRRTYTECYKQYFNVLTYKQIKIKIFTF